LVLVLGAQHQLPQKIAIFAVIAFVSVIVHELGHAMMGRAFGLAPVIELNGMGGLTSWTTPRNVGHWRSIAISVAGPFAGFALGGVLLFADRLGFHPHHPLALFALKQALWVNFGWGIFNLAPMLPLDGGNVLRSALDLVTKGRGEKPARIVSIVMGGLFLVFAFLAGQWWLGALAAFFTWANMQAYRQIDTRNADAPLAQAIEKAYLALEKHDGTEAIALLRPALVPQASDDLRAIALRIYCYALLIEGEWEELLPTLQKNAALIGEEEMARYAKTARELGRLAEADRIMALIMELTPVQPRPANDFG
jgi:Zn-dependent protease